MRLSLPLPLALCAVLASSSGVGTATAAAASRECPARKGTLAADSMGQVWHQRDSLYACTTIYGHRPRARRIGKWAAGTKVAFDGVNVVWTNPLVRNGVRSDRISAANADDGKRWTTGKLLVPAAGGSAEREARVERLWVRDRGAAWVTRTGEVGMALQDPQDAPKPLGALPGPVEPDGQRLLVGAFGEGSVPHLRGSLTLEELPGEGDECGAVNPYRLTFRPGPSDPEMGVEWSGGWTSTNCS